LVTNRGCRIDTAIVHGPRWGREIDRHAYADSHAHGDRNPYCLGHANDDRYGHGRTDAGRADRDIVVRR
jgi:hypothetical protein